MYTDNRELYRQAFYQAWQKHLKKLPLDAVEAQMVEVLILHPEYHHLFAQSTDFSKQEFAIEENPFFHLSLHIALLEQVRMDRPAGIQTIYRDLMIMAENKHDVLHQMMRCLAEMLWEAQKNGTIPDESIYLEKLRALKN